MNSLQQQQREFKQRLAKQPIFKRNIINHNTTNNNNSSTSNNSKLHNKIFDARKIQKKPIFELPVAGTKQRNIGQQLYEVIAYLKTVDEPQTAENLKKFAQVDVYSSEELYKNLTNNNKITFDPEKNTFAYKPVYDIKGKDDLLKLVREHKAMEVKALKDSYSKLMETIKELEEEGNILVIYNKTKGIPMVIYPNNKAYNVETDDVFKDLWHSLKVPAGEDLSKELEKAGLKSMEVYQSKINPKNKVKKKAKQRNRKVKITNTHLEGIDLTKDYVAEKK
ncbi:transcription initiation factor IIE, beta subunit [Piromyces finnis]|uniref:Transcription initiation factor IIE subunit beta n=1 Tax=Piromyces finnis TaxID=1754191 RepID=A0A1Y1VPM9_9FUNG|nr:transcription initiation factor IIE, beta subunit [Piromyces finnis]|eukprot:ORX60821.1 transcription initiation factor IIE, beta subunit [Piromyces finnis]